MLTARAAWFLAEAAGLDREVPAPCGPPRDFLMEAWAASFAEKRNPLYAMLGLRQALRQGKRAPAWAEEEMARMVTAILGIDTAYWHARGRARAAAERAESDDERTKATSALAAAAKEAVDKIPKALGLCRPGYNAFVDAAEARECGWTSLDFGLLEASRFGRDELDRAELVASWHNLSVSAVRKQRTRARALKLSRKGKRKLP